MLLRSSDDDDNADGIEAVGVVTTETSQGDIRCLQIDFVRSNERPFPAKARCIAVAERKEGEGEATVAKVLQGQRFPKPHPFP